MPRELSLAIVGADFPNKKGPSRRFECLACKPGEAVDLVREPKNPHDANAIAVYSCRGVQIGYVRAERAPYIGSEMNRGIVTAIFQQAEPWGATIRVGLDGATPVLPPDNNEARAHDWPPPGSEDADWWPDEEPDWQPDIQCP